MQPRLTRQFNNSSSTRSTNNQRTGTTTTRRTIPTSHLGNTTVNTSSSLPSSYQQAAATSVPTLLHGLFCSTLDIQKRTIKQYFASNAVLVSPWGAFFGRPDIEKIYELWKRLNWNIDLKINSVGELSISFSKIE